MKTNSKNRFLTMLLIGALAVVAPQWAMAITASGTSIANRATVNYKVGTVSQSAIGSSPTGNTSGAGTDTTFLVDDKVIFTIATNNSGYVTTYPGSSAVALKFTVTNTGNTVHDFNLSHIVGTSTFTATSVLYYSDTGGSVAGTYEPGSDTAITYIDELGVDAQKVIYIVATVPLTATNDQVANYALKAVAHAGGLSSSLGAVTTANSGTADTTTSVDVVFADIDSDGTGSDDPKGVDGTNSISSVADGQYNGIYVMWAGGTGGSPEPSNQGYQVSAASLTVTKTSAVYSDPINGTTNPKAIPGAVITYTVTVVNGASAATATSLSVTDSLNTEITATRLAFKTQYNDGVVTTCAAGEGIVVAGACKTNAYTSNDDGVTWDDAIGGATYGATNTVMVTGLSLAAGASTTIKFQVTVQ